MLCNRVASRHQTPLETNVPIIKKPFPDFDFLAVAAGILFLIAGGGWLANHGQLLSAGIKKAQENVTKKK